MSIQRRLQWKRAEGAIQDRWEEGTAFKAAIFDLGVVDVRCIADEERLHDQPSDSTQSEEWIEEVNVLSAVTVFWVFAAYELIRSIKQRVRPDRERQVRLWPQFASLETEILAVEKAVKMARIPLAKFEPHGGRQESVSVARPAWGTNGALGWLVTADRVVTRRELADSLLEVLLKMGQQR